MTDVLNLYFLMVLMVIALIMFYLYLIYEPKISKAYTRNGLDYYYYKCPIHGYVLTYPHGFKKKLYCEKCSEEIKESI